jgi:Fe-Mn family superoxide dismutase
VKNADGSVEIMNTSNAGTPMTSGKKALLTVDVWEHAYYVDYRNARVKYLEEIWKIIDWSAVAANYAA